MKIIQTFYPAEQNIGLSYKSSYVSAEFHWMAWALSCYTLSKFYDVELYTNEEGKRILIDTLKLPYAKVYTYLDHYEPLHLDLWAMPKVYTYSLQKEPFIHVDGDIFIWQKFSEEFLNSGLVAQHKEKDSGKYYETIYNLMIEKDFDIPYYLKEQYAIDGEIIAHNAGIIGGRDIAFIQKYTKLAFDLLERNRDKLSTVPIGMLNVIAEQYVFTALACQDDKAISSLIEVEIEESRDVQLPDGHPSNLHFADFLGVPYQTSFIHLLGYKAVLDVCLMMAKRLLLEAPEYYHRIMKLCNENNIDTSISTNVMQPPSIDLNVNEQLRSEKKLRSAKFSEVNQLDITESPNKNELYDYDLRNTLMLLYNDIKEYESKVNHIDLSQLLGRSMQEDVLQYSLIEKVFGDVDLMNKALFKRNDKIIFIPVLADWTGVKILATAYLGDHKIHKGKMALVYDPLTNKIREVYCDNFVQMMINLSVEPVSLSSLLKKTMTELVDQDSIDNMSQNDHEEYEYFMREQLRQSVFLGLLNINIS